LAAPLSLLLLALARPAQAQYDLTKDLPGPDTPPVGRSFFDFMMVAGDGSTMDVPFPLSKLAARMASRTGVQPQVVMIPKSRSLDRDTADFDVPRVVLGFTDNGRPGGNDLGSYPKDRLFLGFSEKKAQIEVISWNNAAGRFEFQLVEDYRDGGAKKVVYADRILCTQCHRGGAPIFSPALWTETTAWDHDVTVPGSAIAHLTMKGVGQGTDTQTYQDFQIAVDQDIPYKISEGIKAASTFLGVQKLWTDACGRDAANAARCRGYVLQLVMEKKINGGIAMTPSNQALTNVKSMWQTYWASNLSGGIAVPGYELIPFDPLHDLGTDLVPATFADVNAQPLDADATARIQAMLAGSKVPAAKDPIVKANVLGQAATWTVDHLPCPGMCLVYAIDEYLTDVDKAYLATLAGNNLGKMTQAIDALVAANDPSLGNHAFRRGQVIKAIAKQLGDTINGAFYDDEAPALPPLVLDNNLGTPTTGDDPALALLKKYCTPCHATMPELAPGVHGPGKRDFLKGSDSDIMTNVTIEAAEIYRRLSWESPPDDDHAFMPPDGAQNAALTAAPADRQKIQAWMQQLQQGGQ
jgi:hypothetical protein